VREVQPARRVGRIKSLVMGASERGPIPQNKSKGTNTELCPQLIGPFEVARVPSLVAASSGLRGGSVLSCCR
jgi:hypothetical protein